MASDILHGTPGNDVILALGGDDAVFGGKGNDRICSGDGADSIRVGPERTGSMANADADTIASGGGKDLADEARATIRSAEARDVIVWSGGGDPTCWTAAEDTTGSGTSLARGGVRANLSTHTASLGEGLDTLVHVEDLEGCPTTTSWSGT